jgi:hypothetical protein
MFLSCLAQQLWNFLCFEPPETPKQMYGTHMKKKKETSELYCNALMNNDNHYFCHHISSLLLIKNKNKLPNKKICNGNSVSGTSRTVQDMKYLSFLSTQQFFKRYTNEMLKVINLKRQDMFRQLLGYQVSVSVKVLNLYPTWIHIIGFLYTISYL